MDRGIRVEREHYVTVIVAVAAILMIVGGYASFTGLATQSEPLALSVEKDAFRQGDVFDVNVNVGPVTFMSDESIIIYVDDTAVGVIAVKKYLDSNSIEYGTEVKNLGRNNVEIINLKEPLTINLADYVSLEYLRPGTTHILKAEFSRGDASAEEIFRME